jgi:predicted Zn-dependent protease
MQICINMKKTNMKNILGISVCWSLVRGCYCLISLLIYILDSSADTILRDSEIENIIIEAIEPIVKVSGIEKIDITLLQDSAINAFTSGGNRVFLYSGLISRFHDVDVLKGVFAHELGHIVGHHGSRQESNFADQAKFALGAVAIGIVGGLLSNSPDLAMLGALGGSDISTKNLLQHSRVFESSADQYAFNMLEKSRNSVVGLKELFQYFRIEQKNMDLDPYLLTHPLSVERINALNSFIERAKYKTSTSSKSLKDRYTRASYKLLAFTEPTEYAIAVANKVTNPDIALYMKSIIAMRNGDFSQAMQYIDRLIAIYPNDPYYNELKSQIYFEFGQPEALKWYTKTLSLLPQDKLMKMNIAVVAFNIHRNNPDALMQYLHYLKELRIQEPNGLMVYYYLSLYYEAMHNEPMGQVYLALFYNKQHSTKAKILAKSALKKLKPETPEWYWAKDILEENK